MEHLSFDAERDMASVARTLSHAFGSPLDEMRPWLERAGFENVRVVRAGRQGLGCYVQVPMGQFFGGRAVPLVGIAGVAVALEARERGVGRFMMREAVRELADRGVALSTLYPSTQSLYRRAGYERAGKMMEVTSPTDAFVSRSRAGATPSGLVGRELGPDDHASVMALYRRNAEHRPGYLDRGPYNWSRIWKPRRPDGRPATGFGFFDAEGALRAYAFFVIDVEAQSGFHHVRFTDLQALSPEGYRALIAFVASLRSMGRTVSFRAEPSSPLLMPLDEPRYVETSKEDWMLRVVDVRRALMQRGYMRGLTASVTFAVRDEVVSKNNGVFTLDVSGGRGKVTRGSRADIALDVASLAPLYSGHTSAFDLQALGLLDGKPAALARADALFRGATPGMCEMF